MRTLIEDFYDADDREDWDAAMAIAGRALEEFPRDSTGWAMRARICNKMGDAKATAAALAKARELNASCPFAAWTEALLRLNEGPRSYDAALSIVDGALKHDPRHYGCLLARSWILLTMGADEESLACARLAMEAGPRMQRPLANAAAVLDRIGRQKEANSLYEESAARRPEDGMAAYNAGTRLYEAGEHARAIVYLDRARGLLGEWDAVRYNRALVLSALDRHQDTMEEWDTILARQPDWDWALMGRLKSLRALGRTAEAQAFLPRLEGMSDLDTQVLWQLSGIYAADSEDLKAIKCLERMIEQGDGSARVYARLGNCQFELGDDAAARPLLEQALALDEDDAFTHMVYAKTMHRLGELDTALEHVETAIALEPDPGEAQRRVHGEILVVLGRYDEAVPELEAYVRVNADNLAAIQKLIKALMETRKYAAAVVHCNTLIKDGSPDPWSHWMAAGAYAGLKDNAQAIAHYEKARDLYLKRGKNEHAADCREEIAALSGTKCLFSRLFNRG
jgi:tetratricopeptide (TPR) repeat protein